MATQLPTFPLVFAKVIVIQMRSVNPDLYGEHIIIWRLFFCVFTYAYINAQLIQSSLCDVQSISLWG